MTTTAQRADSHRPIFNDLMSRLGCPAWVKVGAFAYVRTPGTRPPYKVSERKMISELVIRAYPMIGFGDTEYAFPAAVFRHHSVDSGEYTAFLSGESTGPWSESSSWEETAPTDRLYRTEREARGGWPLASDKVTCDLPEGTLVTTVVRVFESNGSPMMEVTGGRILPVGTARDPWIQR